MTPGAPLFPKPSRAELHRALDAMGHGNHGPETPDAMLRKELLKIVGRWHMEFYCYDRPKLAPEYETALAWSDRPEVTCLWVALAAYGLPIYRPDYVDWMQELEPNALLTGAILEDAPSRDTLELYVQAMHRAEKWNEGSWGRMVWAGGFYRVCSTLLMMLNGGDWPE